MTEDLFLGKPIKYWLEIDNRAKEAKTDNLILEMAELRAKVSFYESRIRDMAKFAKLLSEKH